MIYLGIDPGKKGGIGVIGPDFFEVYTMPATTAALSSLLADMASTYVVKSAVVEQVQVMGKAFGAKAALSYGQGYGEIIGILSCLHIRTVEVRAATWKKGMLLDKDKNSSILLCERLFPSANIYPTPRCKKPSDGMAEALLLAEYGRRKGL
jgi:hypothetical protein